MACLVFSPHDDQGDGGVGREGKRSCNRAKVALLRVSGRVVAGRSRGEWVGERASERVSGRAAAAGRSRGEWAGE